MKVRELTQEYVAKRHEKLKDKIRAHGVRPVWHSVDQRWIGYSQNVAVTSEHHNLLTLLDEVVKNKKSV